jgi:hypothetical protein
LKVYLEKTQESEYRIQLLWIEQRLLIPELWIQKKYKGFWLGRYSKSQKSKVGAGMARPRKLHISKPAPTVTGF